MAEVIGIKFKDGGKVYYFDPCGIAVEPDQAVIVETARGIECGLVAAANHEVEEEQIVRPLKKLVRIATAKDVAQMEENRRREASAFEICQQKILEHKMDMKLVDVEYTFDNSKVLFYFTADGRVDFRDLVKDLAGVFRTRIELRQIGVRDEAKMLGGLGICGRVFCCSSFLGDFQPVSIKMAKEQGLSLNPTKISGTCGRLMCCLKYEQNAYEDLIRSTPRVGTPVSTPEGNGVVCEISNLITGALKVKIESGEGFVFKNFSKHEVTSLRGEARPSGESGQDGEQPRPPKSDRGERREAPVSGRTPNPRRMTRSSPARRAPENRAPKNRRNPPRPAGRETLPRPRPPVKRRRAPSRGPAGAAEVEAVPAGQNPRRPPPPRPFPRRAKSRPAALGNSSPGPLIFQNPFDFSERYDMITVKIQRRCKNQWHTIFLPLASAAAPARANAPSAPSARPTASTRSILISASTAALARAPALSALRPRPNRT